MGENGVIRGFFSFFRGKGSIIRLFLRFCLILSNKKQHAYSLNFTVYQQCVLFHSNMLPDLTNNYLLRTESKTVLIVSFLIFIIRPFNIMVEALCQFDSAH